MRTRTHINTRTHSFIINNPIKHLADCWLITPVVRLRHCSCFPQLGWYTVEETSESTRCNCSHVAYLAIISHQCRYQSCRCLKSACCRSTATAAAAADAATAVAAAAAAAVFCYCFLSTKIILYSFYYDLTFVLPPVSFIQQQHRWILVFINAQIRGEISKTLTAAALKKLRDDRTEPIVCTYMHTNVSNVWGLFHRRATTTSMTTAIRRSTLFTWVTAINNSYS